MRAFDLACDTCWAIRRDDLETVLAIASRQHGVETEADFEALEARLGRPLDNAHKVTVRDGIATIPVDGVLMPRGNLFTRVSGATSYDTLARDFTAALDDPKVRGVMLAIDSPGGTAKGVQELAALIRSAAGGGKPVWAHSWGQAASAAYWLGTAAERFTMGKTALAGSIGVISAYRNRKSADEIEFVSSVSPKKNLDPTTDAGRAEVQRRVDQYGELFVEEVAAHRRVTPEKVLADFGQGSEFFGREAQALGMVDGVGTFEDTHAEFASFLRPRVSFFFPPGGPSTQAASLTIGVQP
jgi:ClpP class serine protease